MPNPNIPEKCNFCEKPLLLENLFVDDGCPCNSRLGVNFPPRMCYICNVSHCVKPGHRLDSLYGLPYVLRVVPERIVKAHKVYHWNPNKTLVRKFPGTEEGYLAAIEFKLAYIARYWPDKVTLSTVFKKVKE